MRAIDADKLIDDLYELKYTKESPSIILTPAGQEIYNSGVESAIGAVLGAPTIGGIVPKWISVKERLPVKQLRVIVCDGHDMVAAGWRSYHRDVKGGELWEVDGAHNYRNDITHWMPMPEPPVK